MGEPVERIAAVSVWRESSFFTARERAAFALTDTMTRTVDTHVPDTDWRMAAAHLTPQELSALVALVVVINAWDMVGVNLAWILDPHSLTPINGGNLMETQFTEAFSDFMVRREEASNDYIRGNAQGVAGMLTHRDPATFMPPHGAVIEGATTVETAQIEGASAFDAGSSGHFDVLNSGASGDLAFWTGRQVATIDIKGSDEPVPMILRTTEVFRREDGQWKLVHRHADIPAPPQE